MGKQDKLEEIHCKLDRWSSYRHLSSIEKWREIRHLVYELEDVIYQEKTKCPLCGSLDTRTRLKYPENEIDEKTYVKECVTCAHIWKTSEI